MYWVVAFHLVPSRPVLFFSPDSVHRIFFCISPLIDETPPQPLPGGEWEELDILYPAHTSQPLSPNAYARTIWVKVTAGRGVGLGVVSESELHA